jgi:hypothetical protein
MEIVFYSVLPCEQCRGTMNKLLFLTVIIQFYAQSINVIVVDSELRTIITDLKVIIKDSTFFTNGNFTLKNSYLNEHCYISHSSYNDTSLIIDQSEIYIQLRKKIYQASVYDILERKIYDNKEIIKLNNHDRNSLSVTDLFDSKLDVNHNSYSGYGSLNQFRIRGSSPDHTIVMIEGVRLNNFQNGGYNLSSFSLGQVSEVEIYKSGASAKNGSDAMGGVINFKMGSLQKNLIYFSENISSYNTYNHKLGFNLSNEIFSLSSSFNHKKSDNYFPARISRDKIGYRNYSDFSYYAYDINFSYKVNDNSEILYIGMFTENDAGTPGAGAVTLDDFQKGALRQKDENFFNLISYRNYLNGNSELKVTLSHFPSKLTFDKLQTYTLNENSIKFDYQTSLFSNILTKVNYELHNSRLDADRGTGSFKAYRERHSFVVSVNQKLNNFFYDLTLREEVYGNTNPFFKESFYSINQIKKQSSPLIYDITVKYNLSGDYSVSINNGRHYRKPTFNQLYWPTVDGSVKAEYAYSSSFYLNYQKQNIKASLNLFTTNFNDLIVWTNSLNTINLNEVKQYGSEINLSAEFLNHYISLQFLYNRFYNVENNLQVNNTPKLSFVLNYSSHFQAFKFETTFKWSDRYFLRNGFEHPDEFLFKSFIAYQTKIEQFDLSFFNRTSILLNTYNSQLNIYSPPFSSYPKAGLRFELGVLINFNLMRNK